ncbi:MAG: (Fe-S)-binding protein [Chloroflexi bacterium]|nr:(Fe-S)-binding protein [Chloroflexota bacterium]
MKVSLFVTCLVDQLFPEVGESVVKLLRRVGIEVEFPREQTCCGQPALNSGFMAHAKPLARRWLDLFEESQYVVVPSGSCAAMLKVSVPEMFRQEAGLYERAQALAGRTYELSQFLVNVLRVQDLGARFPGKVTYHPSCHLLRELGAATEAQTLIRGVRGIQFVPLDNPDRCCGFGGTFSVKYPSLSGAILEEKLRAIEATGADVVVACDSGCLMHIAGGMRRRGMKVEAMHLAQILAQTAPAEGAPAEPKDGAGAG